MAKDAKGHGSEGRSGGIQLTITPQKPHVPAPVTGEKPTEYFKNSLASYAATHQSGIESSVPNEAGANLWAALSARVQANEAKINNPASRELSGLSPADLRGMT